MRKMKTAFTEDLARFGPGAAYEPPDRGRARLYCSRLARSHYENFTVASVLLPRHLLRHFHAVYAYCRWADDLADETREPEEALALLRWWRQELLACYEGRARHPVFVALQETVRDYRIPPQPFLDLLGAFEQDQVVRRYRTFDELRDYCRRSANPVGRLVLYLSGAFDETRAALSDHVCTALQLANFWQDVGRDFEIGRVYLPEEDRKHFGYSEADLQGRCITPEFAELLRFEVDRTRDLFYRGLPLVDLVPGHVRADVELFIQGGLAVLRKIEDCGYDVWASRPALAGWEKGALLAGALWRRLRAGVLVW
jgi:squalene synthase HpnC